MISKLEICISLKTSNVCGPHLVKTNADKSVWMAIAVSLFPSINQQIELN